MRPIDVLFMTESMAPQISKKIQFYDSKRNMIDPNDWESIHVMHRQLLMIDIDDSIEELDAFAMMFVIDEEGEIDLSEPIAQPVFDVIDVIALNIRYEIIGTLKKGNLCAHLALSYDTLEDYINSNSPYFEQSITAQQLKEEISQSTKIENTPSFYPWILVFPAVEIRYLRDTNGNILSVEYR